LKDLERIPKKFVTLQSQEAQEVGLEVEEEEEEEEEEEDWQHKTNHS